MTYNEIVKAHQFYLCGASLEKTAKRYGTTRQRLFSKFKRLSLPTRSLKKKDYILHNDEKFSVSRDGYYRKTSGNREHLHQIIWRESNMPEILEDECLVFIDGNKQNYEIKNLKKMTISEFAKSQPFRGNQYTKRV